MEKQSTPDKILKWIAVAAAISSLGIGAFFLEARHSVQVSEIKDLIKSENAKYSKQIEANVTRNIQTDLRQFRDSINSDHRRLMNANYKKDSLLLIVVPRVLDEVKKARNSVEQMQSIFLADSIESKDPVLEYLIEKEKRDSTYQMDHRLMREVRRINELLLGQPKFNPNQGERAK